MVINVLFFILLLIGSLSLFSCEMEDVYPDTGNSPCDYSKYSTTDFDFVQKNLIVQSPFGASYFPFEQYSYSDPVFNPANPFEIAYLRSNTDDPGECKNELWKFSFCNGIAKKITSDVCYSPDWSIDGWIIFTANDRELWKVKDNGDSLTQLTNTGPYNNHAKWSPNGKQYGYRENQLYRIASANGEIIQTIPWIPIAWLNDHTILGTDFGSLAFYDLSSSNERIVHDHAVTISFPFDPETQSLYTWENAGITSDADDHWLRLDLKSGSKDTLKKLWDSYYYGQGEYSTKTKKAVVELFRRDWKDSIRSEIYMRSHILIMNPDGTGERLVILPE